MTILENKIHNTFFDHNRHVYCGVESKFQTWLNPRKKNLPERDLDIWYMHSKKIALVFFFFFGHYNYK